MFILSMNYFTLLKTLRASKITFQLFALMLEKSYEQETASYRLVLAEISQGILPLFIVTIVQEMCKSGIVWPLISLGTSIYAFPCL